MCSGTTDCIISENLCGHIDIKDAYYHTIWQAIGLSASVTIKIINQSSYCLNIKFKKSNCIIIRIFPNDEQNITLSNVNNIAIQCDNPDTHNPCYGSYQLIIHYLLVSCNETRCRKPLCNEAIGWC